MRRSDARGEGLDERVAAALDKSVNGTSLMLLLQVGDATLLFPGDAQWGTWKKVLETPALVELVKTTKFYKVGHHGSENATPVEFVEAVAPRGMIAMVSTGSVTEWPNIPKPALLTALGERSEDQVARSDRALSQGTVFRSASAGVVEATLPA